MNNVKRLLAFLWEFVIGDDWRIALAVAVAMLLTLALSNSGATVWWLLPAVVASILTTSVWAVARRRG